MSLFDRYFLVLAGRVPESEAGIVATAALKSGMLTLDWPLDTPATSETDSRSMGYTTTCRQIRIDRRAS